MHIHKHITKMEPPPEQPSSLSGRGYFWIGWLCGMGNAAALWIAALIITRFVH